MTCEVMSGKMASDKRIAQASYNISVTAGISGVLIFFEIGKIPIIPVINVSIYGLVLFFHVICAFAIITQAAAIAIAHDMWEDKEFEKETVAGVVPPHPMQQKGESSRQWRKLYAKNHTMFMV
jgi:hypothetical protein